MPSKSKDKGKAAQQKLESLKCLHPSKLFYLGIYSTKPIKSWIDMITKEEETNHSFQVQTWVDSISNSLELLMALYTIRQKSS